MKGAEYLDSFTKRFFDLVFGIFVIILMSPLFLFITVMLFVSQGSPIFFKQKRTGKDGKTFNIYKFRSMYPGSENKQKSLQKLNEVGFPVFKISDDPRFTRIGKILSKTGLDEFPQLINVIKGEMSMVGPRPLPVNEAAQLNKTQFKRHRAKPGITSEWVVGGSHDMTFKKWMILDADYLANASLQKDISILLKTAKLVAGFVLKLL